MSSGQPVDQKVCDLRQFTGRRLRSKIWLYYLSLDIRLGLYITLRINEVNIRSTKWNTQEQSISHNPDVR